MYQDKKPDYFLEKVYSDHDYIYSRVANEKYYKVKNSKLIIKTLNDDYRRSKQFQKYFYKKDILDFGCGFGNLFKLIKNPKSLSGVEIREIFKKYIKKNFKKVENNSEIKEINKKFDTITLFHVLEHLHIKLKFKNIKSKLKKG